MGHLHSKEHIEKSGIVWPLRSKISLSIYEHYWIQYSKGKDSYGIVTFLSWTHDIVIVIKQDIELISKKSVGRSKGEV